MEDYGGLAPWWADPSLPPPYPLPTHGG